MKEKFLRFGSLYFCFILFACLSFHSCNSDDDDDMDGIIEQTWLEKYDGTKWVDGEEFVYLRIVNNINIISESWVNDPPCYIYNVADEDVVFEIIENSLNKLVFDVVGDDFQRNTYTVSGNTLTWVIEYEFWDEPATLTFQRTNADVDNFEICDW